jgi:hypothetical protein
VIAKPTVADLGIDPDTQQWQRSGTGAGTIEVAFVQAPGPAATPPTPPAPPVTRVPPASTDNEDWVLMRVTDDPEGRVLVFDRNEWECFLDGARKGEFDDATGPGAR